MFKTGQKVYWPPLTQSKYITIPANETDLLLPGDFTIPVQRTGNGSTL